MKDGRAGREPGKKRLAGAEHADAASVASGLRRARRPGAHRRVSRPIEALGVGHGDEPTRWRAHQGTPAKMLEGAGVPTHSTAEERRVELAEVLPATPTDVYKEMLGSFLMEFQWDSFFTGTFRQAMSAAGTMVLFERWLKRVAWRISVGKAPGTPFRWATKPYAAVFHEVGRTTGRDHVHALVGNVKPLPVYCGKKLPPGWFGHFSCCLMHYWPHGIARAVEYDVSKGATHYLTKYTTKALGEWRVVGCPKRVLDTRLGIVHRESTEVL